MFRQTTLMKLEIHREDPSEDDTPMTESGGRKKFFFMALG
jgi:hypothetical protein